MKMTPLTMEDTSIDSSNFSVDRMIASLSGLLETGIKIPFTSKILIDEDRFFDVIDDLRKTLPSEIDRAHEVLIRQSTIIADAESRAEKLMQQAHSHAQNLIEDQEVHRMAVAEAQRLRDDAQLEVAKQVAEADRYAEEVLAQLETKIARALETITNGRNTLAKS